jgi:hypothetical protein
MSAIHQTPRHTHALRIGAIGREIGAAHAATQCVEFARRRGSVLVTVDDGGVCWALMPGSVPAAHALERKTSHVVGTFAPGEGAPRGIVTVVREGIVERMRELGALEWAA